ncbi:MAG: hypothetical protein K2H20_01795, partial [Bacilli bacterium]|nr:hypothetical protein [Bacilli bacterium]
SRYVELYESRFYILMGICGLFKEFVDFPELEDVAIRLVDLKIAHPSMSDEERLLRVLKNVKTNEENLSESEYFDKAYLNGKKLKSMSLSEVYSVKKR